MADLNWAAIHSAYNEHKTKMGNAQPAHIPQPQGHSPAYAMMIHAMSQQPTQPGEDHGTMILRALEGHLKRITPDVSGIHKQPTAP